MKRILSFGGGLQTTAMAVMVAKGELQIDEAIFSDTGGEKPETYWYIDNYIKSLLKEANVPFVTVRNEKTKGQLDLYHWLWKFGQIPPVHGLRLCSIKFKREAIERYIGDVENITMIGFSLDEAYRAEKNKRFKKNVIHPLIERRITALDCHKIIADYGLPQPLKSSCYYCPFQHPTEWNWLKNNHHDLFQKALELEANYHKRRPDMIDFGLVRGMPLRHFKKGIQVEMFSDVGFSCWDGHCGH